MADTALQHLLEGDGIITNLFYFLYKKKLTGHVTPATELGVPSTVVFEHNFPKAWYYHPGGIGTELERRLGKDIDSHQIVREFCAQHLHGPARGRGGADTSSGSDDDCGGGGSGGRGIGGHSDIVATYMSNVDVEGAVCTRVEFLGRKELEDFLMKRTRRPDGFLQKWVEPTGKYNTVVQAVWSPHLCIVTKRQNALPVRDRRHGAYERCVTFEGPTHFSTQVLVAPHIKWQVQMICKELVDHLFATQKIAVKRMVLHFKVDRSSNIWLLWCSSVRVGDGAQLNLAPQYVRQGEHEQEEEAAMAQRISRLLQSSGDLDEVESPSRREVKRRESGGSGIRFPRPPSMGPIGDIFTDNPQWSEHYQQLVQARMRMMRQKKRKNQATANDPAGTPLAPPPPGRPAAVVSAPHPVALSGSRRKRSKKKHAKKNKKKTNKTPEKEEGAATTAQPQEANTRPATTTTVLDSEASSFVMHHSTKDSDWFLMQFIEKEGAPPAERGISATDGSMSGMVRSFGVKAGAAVRSPRTPQQLWGFVRLAVRCKLLLLMRARAEGEEWCRSLLYCVYSHFLCSRGFLVAHVPKYLSDILNSEEVKERGSPRPMREHWMARLGIVWQSEKPPVPRPPPLPVVTPAKRAATADAAATPATVPSKQRPLQPPATFIGPMQQPGADGGAVEEEAVLPSEGAGTGAPSVGPQSLETVYIIKMDRPLADIQLAMSEMLEKHIRRASSKVLWYFTAMKWVQEKFGRCSTSSNSAPVAALLPAAAVVEGSCSATAPQLDREPAPLPKSRF